MTTSQSLYEPGTYIDLTYLNERKRPSVRDIMAEQFQSANEFEPGTYIDLSFVGRQMNLLSSLVNQAQLT